MENVEKNTKDPEDNLDNFETPPDNNDSKSSSEVPSLDKDVEEPTTLNHKDYPNIQNSVANCDVFEHTSQESKSPENSEASSKENSEGR